VDLLPFYTYLNRLFQKIIIPREGDSSNIPSYNQNFIWEEIKAISESPLKSCGYAPYIVHMIERVLGGTFRSNREHHPLRIKNDLQAPVDQRRVAAP
jgi:hypothetical protein